MIRVTPQALPAVGESLRLALRSEALHFFDPASGERLTTSAS